MKHSDIAFIFSLIRNQLEERKLAIPKNNYKQLKSAARLALSWYRKKILHLNGVNICI